jgi:hypothetical protein
MRQVLVAENDPDLRTMLMASATPSAPNAVRTIPTTVSEHARTVLHTAPVDLLVIGAGSGPSAIASATELVVHAYRYHPVMPVVVLSDGACRTDADGVSVLGKPVDFRTYARVVADKLAIEPAAARMGLRFSGLLAALTALGANADVQVRNDGNGETALVSTAAGALTDVRCGELTGADALAAILEWDRPRVAVTLADEVEGPTPTPAPRRRGEPRTNAPMLGAEGHVDHRTARVRAAMDDAMIPGAIGLALIDATSGLVLGAQGTTIKFEIAAAGMTTTLATERRVLRDLGVQDDIEDIMITLDRQYHLLRPVGRERLLFLYFVLRREAANLAAARMALRTVERALGL